MANKKVKDVLYNLRAQEEATLVGNRIKALREKSGEKQEFIAKYLRERGFKKASRQLVSAIETGKQHPNLKMLVAFADHFNVSVDFLLGRISYQTDRDRQFEQFMLMYRKAIKDQEWDVREYFNTSINEVYWILSKILEYGQKDKLSRFADILSEFRLLVYNATEVLNKGKMTKDGKMANDDVNKILTELKILYEEKERVLGELSAIISDLAIPYNARPKISEFQAFVNEFDKLNFDEEQNKQEVD